MFSKCVGMTNWCCLYSWDWNSDDMGFNFPITFLILWYFGWNHGNTTVTVIFVIVLLRNSATFQRRLREWQQKLDLGKLHDITMQIQCMNYYDLDYECTILERPPAYHVDFGSISEWGRPLRKSIWTEKKRTSEIFWKIVKRVCFQKSNADTYSFDLR